MTFLYPSYLYILLILPILAGWYFFRCRDGHASLRLPSLAFLDKLGKNGRVWFMPLPIILRLSALSLLIVALARPQTVNNWDEQDVQGIDIMLTMDISTSMLSMDFEPNRLEAAKMVAANFVARRQNDNVGLVVFAGESFTASPMTTDHATVLNRISQMKVGIIEDRTAIGLGLVTAINRLRISEAESKVIILLTDGSNNAGDISPIMAAQLAKSLGITIHTIGMGSLDGFAPYPVFSGGFSRYTNMPVDIDEDTMREVAEITGGIYYRASDNKGLDAIYKEIDSLEKTKLRTHHVRAIKELYPLFIFWALMFLVAEFILRHTILRVNP